ncbi:MAG TPA: hypothetical protein VFW93_17450, partial [Aquabacterium sp.]|nr:hypothetical protein [Aquabacterium sp.]
AAGIPSCVADANLVQAHSWMANAVGGVRVQVPASFVERAKQVLAEYEEGAYQLDGEDQPCQRPATQATNLALWGPDIAAFWSMSLTPLFGTTIHYLNSRTLNYRTRSALVWWLLSVVVTIASLYSTLSIHWELAGVLLASSMASAFTVVWYIFSGYAQSRHVVSNFGSQYVKRPLFPLWLGTVIAMIALGSAESLFQ